MSSWIASAEADRSGAVFTHFGGTFVIAGYAGGREADNVTDIIWKAATIRGFTFRLFTPQTVAAAKAALLACGEEGTLQPTISRSSLIRD